MFNFSKYEFWQQSYRKNTKLSCASQIFYIHNSNTQVKG